MTHCTPFAGPVSEAHGWDVKNMMWLVRGRLPALATDGEVAGLVRPNHEGSGPRRLAPATALRLTSNGGNLSIWHTMTQIHAQPSRESRTT